MVINIVLEAESERPHHKRALRSLLGELQPLFDGSSEGIFIYLDDEHKACNDRLADMFDYTPLQWAEAHPFNRLFSDESKDDVIAGYYEKIIGEKAPMELNFTGVKKNGSTFKARLLMVPITYDGVLFALGFVR